MNMKNVVYPPKILLAHLIDAERRRNRALDSRYRRALDALPKGKPYLRRRGKSGKAYLYLSRRLPGRKHPESKYVGPEASDRVRKLERQLEDRSRLEAQLAILAIERRMIERALDEYRRARSTTLFTSSSSLSVVRRGKQGIKTARMPRRFYTLRAGDPVLTGRSEKRYRN